jgi:hypothetical protein
MLSRLDLIDPINAVLWTGGSKTAQERHVRAGCMQFHTEEIDNVHQLHKSVAPRRLQHRVASEGACPMKNHAQSQRKKKLCGLNVSLSCNAS